MSFAYTNFSTLVNTLFMVIVWMVTPYFVNTIQAQTLPPNTNSPVGTNLTEVNDWSSEITFVDAFKSARAWIPQNDNKWDTEEYALLDLDAQGWVRSIPRPEDSPEYEYVSTLLMMNEGRNPAGQYIVLYDGEGTIVYGDDAVKDEAASRPGRDVLNVTPSYAIKLTIRITDPNHTGNYIRNIRVILPGFEQNYATQIFYPNFLTRLRSYKALRFMDWMRTNNSPQASWSNRPKPSDAIYSTEKGVPLETMITLANQLSVDPWFTLPHKADDEYIRQFATLTRDTLATNRKVYVEYSNEVWNGMFEQGDWIEAQAQAEWSSSNESSFTKRINWFGKRTAQICDIWEQVWGAQSNRVICVMGGWAISPWLGEQSLDCPLWDNAPCIAHHVDAIAIAPYFGYYLGDPEYENTLQTWTNEVDGGLNKLFTELGSGGLLAGGPVGGAIQDASNNIAGFANLSQARNLALITYEGGQHLAGVGSAQNNAAITKLFTSANRDPRMGTLYTQYLNLWRQNGGQLFMHYVNVSSYSKSGSWGSLEYVDQTSSPKFDALQNFIQNNPCWWTGCGTTGGNATATPTPSPTLSPTPTATPTIPPTPIPPTPIPTITVAPTINPGTLDELVIGFGPGAAGKSDYQGYAGNSYRHLTWTDLPWASYNTSICAGETHPASGDLTGNGLSETVNGLATCGKGWLQIRADGAQNYNHLAWIQVPWAEYITTNGGETWPALGNIDKKDAAHELVIGLGKGARGWLQVRDDANSNYANLGWFQVPWPEYNSQNGETRPATGDVDGDGEADLVIGFGNGGNGRLEIRKGTSGNYAHLAWLQVPWTAYNAANGATRPALGDVDGDGKDEIIVGFDTGGEGRFVLYDDASTQFALLRWHQVQWSAYNSANGATRPSAGNLDNDQCDELVLGLGTASNAWYEIFDLGCQQVGHKIWLQSKVDGYTALPVAQTWPSVGNFIDLTQAATTHQTEQTASFAHDEASEPPTGIAIEQMQGPTLQEQAQAEVDNQHLDPTLLPLPGTEEAEPERDSTFYAGPTNKFSDSFQVYLPVINQSN